MRPLRLVLARHGVALAANIDGSFAASRLLSNTTTVLLQAKGRGWRCLRWDDIDLG